MSDVPIPISARYHYGVWTWEVGTPDVPVWRTVEIELGVDGVELRVAASPSGITEMPEVPTLVLDDDLCEAMLRACLDHVEHSMSTSSAKRVSTMYDQARRLTLMREGLRMVKAAIEQEHGDPMDEPF